ncbi:Pyruvate formate-lyase activating enzyme [Salmonella enterica subsp. enterica]|uniref:Pyruvate formate-lyase activating enzyme n=1 Tax=Salmonella enterica I TaxID=59201 RepID=A0A447N092_SALET|nr:Pyruvate formate-lyase activating enzyme [Salmonella enterica subsp. enterica]
MLKDDIFFRTSGGGVTLSGGEVLMQAPFATRFLQRLRRWAFLVLLKRLAIRRPAVYCRWQGRVMKVLFDLKNYGCGAGARG